MIRNVQGSLCNILKFMPLLLLISFLISNKVYAQLPTLDVVEEQVSILNPDTDSVSINKLQQIKKQLQSIQALQQENTQLQMLLDQAPQRKVELYLELQKTAGVELEPISESALSGEIEQSLATEKARHKEWVDQFSLLKEQQQKLLDDQETLPGAIAEQEQILDKLIKENKTSQDTVVNKIDKWLSEVEQAFQEEKLKGLILQQDTLAQRREQSKINAQILESELTRVNKKIELLQVRLLDVTAQSSLKVIEQTKQLSRTLSDAPSVIQQWNAKNETLAVEFETLNRQFLLTQQTIQELETQRQRVIQNMAQVKGNIKWLKNSPAFSDAIRAQLLLLPELSDKSNLEKSITAAHLKHFQISSELFKLKDIPLLISEEAAKSDLNALHQKVLSSILDFRYEMLTRALEKTDNFIAEITRLDALQDQFSVQIQRERDFLKEKQLFIRDMVALWDLSANDINGWFSFSGFPERAKNVLKKGSEHSAELVLIGFFFILIAFAVSQLNKIEKNYLIVYAKVVGKVRKDSFLHTFILLLLAVSHGALLALCLFAIDRWIELRLMSFYSYELNNIFIASCYAILIWESLIRLAMFNGVLQLHFGFPKEVIAWLKSTLIRQRWIFYSLLLGMLISEMLSKEGESGLLRIVFITLIMWLIFFIRKLLKPAHLVIFLPKFMQSSGALKLLKLLFILPLIGIILLAVWGYFYASWIALFYYYAVLLSFGSALLLQLLGVRWLNIEQRKISLQRALEKREEQNRDKADEIDETVLPVQEISEQSLTLLNFVVVVFLFVMLSTLLSDSLQALQWMDDVVIWEVVTATDVGNIVEPITLKAALSALIIFGLSIFLEKNLPGVLELLLLHRLNISTGAAYATTTLLRYLIVLCGILIAVSTLGFNWSKLQWLVAALSVGLGFGLQEIFANFVSGIILLFERPIRVGDTITIQGLSGVVMRINTRATTILDWDKKEIVVPNKSLITEQLVNWSLTDAMTRIIIPIGVAYGSDVQLVKQLLIQTADECVEVSKEPKPQALFLLFGASSLDFELRIFLPQIEGRPAIIDKINTRIDQLFKQHKIEIPFPQMDIHVRDLPAKMSDKDQ